MKLLTPRDPEWPMLFEIAAPVTDIATQVTPHLHPMREIMLGHNGVGLAAPQVGIPLQFFITDLMNTELDVVINPLFLSLSSQWVSAREGCLSWSGGKFTTYVRRHEWVDVTFTNQRGEVIREDLWGMEARVFQHETDHLQGVTIFTPTPCRAQPTPV